MAAEAELVTKHYITDPYRVECEATVTAVMGNRVLLSDTVFYPEGGGQVGDTGWIGDSRVMDTRKTGGQLFAHPEFPDTIMINGEVAHILAEGTAPPSTDSHLPVKIDWPRRLRNMRHHSAAHLGFWFATTARPDLYVKGARIDGENARFDFYTRDRLSPEAVVEWEERANEIIQRDLEIWTAPVNGENEARIWHCGEMTIPCGGTHVRSTGEIGRIKLRRKRQGTNLERLYITIVD